MQVRSVIKILSLFLVILDSSTLLSMQYSNSEICNQLKDRYDYFSEDKIFSYECCNRSFRNRDSLRSHLMIFHNICFDCLIPFDSCYHLALHMKSSTTHGNRICEYCKQIKAKSIKELDTHKVFCHFRPGIKSPNQQQGHNVADIINIQIKQEFHTHTTEYNFQNTPVHPLQQQVNFSESWSFDDLNELFSSENQALSEILSNDNEYHEHVCGACGTSFPGITELEVHCLGEHLRCPWCLDFQGSGTFDSENKKLFALHAGTMHPERNIYYCEKCDIFTDDITQTARHIVSCVQNSSKLLEPHLRPLLNIQPRPSM